MKIRITESKLKQIIRETVSEAVNGSDYKFSEENGVNRRWLRNNSAYTSDYREVDRHYGTGKLRKAIEDAALNDEELALYFSEESNDIQELRGMLVSFIETEAPLPKNEKDHIHWNILMGPDRHMSDSSFNSWVNELMWKMREKYRSDRRPTTREQIDFLKKNFRDYEENRNCFHKGDDNIVKSAVRNIVDYIRDNDPVLYSEFMEGKFDNVHELFIAAKERYGGMWE